MGFYFCNNSVNPNRVWTQADKQVGPQASKHTVSFGISAEIKSVR